MGEIISYEEVIKQNTKEIVETVIEELKEIENNPEAILSKLMLYSHKIKIPTTNEINSSWD